MNLYLTGVVLIFTGGLLSLFLPQRLKGWFVMLLCAAGVVPVTLSSVPVILHGGGITGSLRLAPPVGQITLSLDALSALFALLISLIVSDDAPRSTVLFAGVGQVGRRRVTCPVDRCQRGRLERDDGPGCFTGR